MQIRPAQPSDCNQLIRLLLELGYRTTEDIFREQSTVYDKSDFCRLLVAESDENKISGLIAGSLIPLMHQSGSLGRITVFVVGLEFREHGVGTALLSSLEKWFKENNCLRIEVTSGDHREAAHRFYEARGYIQDERRFIKSNVS